MFLLASFRRLIILFLFLCLQNGIGQMEEESDECQFEEGSTSDQCITTTPNPTKKKISSAFKAGAKKVMLKFIFLGKKRAFSTELDEHNHRHLDLAEGVFVELNCPGVNTRNRENVSWWFNGEKIEAYFLDWRKQISAQGQLLLSPVLLEDTGNFECFLNEEHRGILFLNIESLKMALLDGYMNFLVVASISLGFTIVIALYRIILLLRSGKEVKEEEQ